MKLLKTFVITCICVVAVMLAIQCSGGSKELKPQRSILLPDSAGVSVFELLEATHDVEYDKTPSGIFVKSIDGIENSREVFWLYYVNDSSGTVACDRFIVKKGDKVEWRLMSAN